MIQVHGRWWPDDVGDRWAHALKHLGSLEIGIGQCTTRRTAVQAGGNVGLWPARLATSFSRVFTFEPDAESRACLELNVPANVVVSPAALGASEGFCGLRHKGLGSHRVIELGAGIPLTTIDALGIYDLDFLQLDIEGYELHALQGGRATIERCRPIIQVELRNFTSHFGLSDAAVREWLTALGYRQVRTAPGSDYVFRWGK